MYMYGYMPVLLPGGQFSWLAIETQQVRFDRKRSCNESINPIFKTLQLPFLVVAANLHAHWLLNNGLIESLGMP